MTDFRWEILSDTAGKRLDLFLHGHYPDWSRSRIQKLIREGQVLVNGQAVKTGEKLKAGDCVELTIPPAEPDRALPESIPLDIVYEDSELIVVNKPRGMVVHPAAGHNHGTLVNALLAHCHDLAGINNTLRPGIVHRLDKDTTGLLVAAKNERTMKYLTKQMKDRLIKRCYTLLVHGEIRENTGMIDAPVGRHLVQRKKMAVVENGRRAVTRFQVLKRYPKYTLVEAHLETGRTHQIRVHFSYIGYPVVGDPIYGRRKNPFNLDGQALHAGLLAFVHPVSHEEMVFRAPLPEDFQEVMDQLDGLSLSS